MEASEPIPGALYMSRVKQFDPEFCQPHKQVPALKDYPKEDRPNSTVQVFWALRPMASTGYHDFRAGQPVATLPTPLCNIRGPYALCAVDGAVQFIAILAVGWVTTEVGRQPWVVGGLLRTRDAVSAHSTQ